jgi:hypothetical protein
MSSKHLGFKFLIAFFLVFFSLYLSLTFTHSLSFLFFFSLSFTLIHSPFGFLCSYKTHLKKYICCKKKQIANNIIHVANQLRRLRVPVDPSMKLQRSFQLCKRITVVVDNNSKLSEGWVRLDLDCG